MASPAGAGSRRTPVVVAVVAATAAVVAAAIALVVVSTARSHPAAVPSPGPTTVAAATTTPPSGGAAPSTVAVTSTSIAGARNESATDAVKTALAAAYVTGTPGLSGDDVAGPAPGSVYLAEDTTTGDRYAVATFVPSASFTNRFGNLAPTAPAHAAFTAGPYTFTETGSSGWMLSGALGSATACPPFPAPVLQVWGLAAGSCRFATG